MLKAKCNGVSIPFPRLFYFSQTDWPFYGDVGPYVKDLPSPSFFMDRSRDHCLHVNTWNWNDTTNQLDKSRQQADRHNTKYPFNFECNWNSPIYHLWGNDQIIVKQSLKYASRIWAFKCHSSKYPLAKVQIIPEKNRHYTRRPSHFMMTKTINASFENPNKKAKITSMQVSIQMLALKSLLWKIWIHIENWEDKGLKTWHARCKSPHWLWERQNITMTNKVLLKWEWSDSCLFQRLLHDKSN